MQLIKVIPHGILAKQFKSFEVAGTTVAEAIEGWSRQLGIDQIPFDKRPVVTVLDHEDEASLYAETTVNEIHLVPAMFGGGAVGRIIIGGLMIAGGFLLSTVPGLQVVGTALISAGIGMVIGGVMELFMKQPKVDKDEGPEASKYLGSGNNTTAIGTIMGMGGGRMKIGGHFLSLQVDSSDMVHGRFPASP